MTTASDVPVREPGTRSRSGNAMGRTRAALLLATGECVARYGIRKTTMVDVASKSRVAKATLYNHFRTKDDVLAALVEQQVTELVGVAVPLAGSQGLVAALTEVALWLASSAPLRKAAESEQALLAPLLLPTDGRGWATARDGVAAVLQAGQASHGAAEVELVLRWCASQVLWPLDRSGALAAAQALVQGLSPSSPGVAADPPTRTPSQRASSAGLGWPA